MKTFIKVLTVCLIASACLMQSAWAESEVVYQTIAMESANQSFDGQIAVAQVIINRAKRSNRSLEAVCKAPRQFSCWNDQKRAKAWLTSYYTPKVRLGAEMALKRAINEQSQTKITHYHTKQVRPYWSKGHTPSLVIGEHVFYEGIR